jgi:hypothetical protein
MAIKFNSSIYCEVNVSYQREESNEDHNGEQSEVSPEVVANLLADITEIKNRQEREKVLYQAGQEVLKTQFNKSREDEQLLENEGEGRSSHSKRDAQDRFSIKSIVENLLSSKTLRLLEKARFWITTSRMFPTFDSQRNIKTALKHDKSQDIVQTSEMSFGNRKGDFGGADQAIGYHLLAALGFYLLRALGPDGYNPETGMLTCADGTTKKMTFVDITWTSFFLRLFALPSRPMSLDDQGKLQYRFLQVLYSFAGTSWNPVKETITGDLLEFEEDAPGRPIRQLGTDRQRTRIKEEKVSFYQRRWTEKKGFLLSLAVIRVPLFVVFNLVTWPFRFVRTLLKIVTEILLPLISYGLIKLVEAFYDLTQRVCRSVRKSGISPHLFWQGPAFVLTYYITAVAGLVQYLMSLICRIALAFTSPLTSALLAYQSGVLILGSEYSTHLFPRFVGGLGFVLSMAISATLWAITFPLALGALVTAVPALLTPITALSQSPFMANVLAWLTQLPIVASLSTAFGTAFGVVGGPLTATFGVAIGYLGTFVGVAIPQVVVAFSLILSTVLMPALTFVTWGVEALSNLIMQWVEQRPFYTLITKLKMWGSKEEGAEKEQNARGIDYIHPLYIHQAVPGGDIVVGLKACHLVSEKEENGEKVRKQVEILKVGSWVQSKNIFSKAHADIGHSNQRSRFTRPEEEKATHDIPMEFKGVEHVVQGVMR